MIFVTVGTDNHDFSRLVKAMDQTATKKDIVMQIGHTVYEPKNAKWFRFESETVIEEMYNKADVIVTHAGAGSIIRSLQNNKIPVVVPRLKNYGEHVNNHQLDLAQNLAKMGKVVLVEDISLLKESISRKYENVNSDKSVLTERIRSYLIAHEKKIS